MSSFSNFIYLDTLVFKELVKNKGLVRPLFDFLRKEDLCIAVSQALWLELSPKKHTHQTIDAVLTCLPSAVIKKPDQVLTEESSSYPNMRKDTLLLSPLNALMGKQIIQQKLSSVETANARTELLQYSRLMSQRLNQLKPNFPPPYTLERAEVYAEYITIQWLLMELPSFMKQFSGDISRLNTDVFKSIKVFAYYTYYKYYNQDKEDFGQSAFGDLFHLYCMPYCHLVIVERDMCHILNQIKRRHRVLDGVRVKNIGFFDELG